MPDLSLRGALREPPGSASSASVADRFADAYLRRDGERESSAALSEKAKLAELREDLMTKIMFSAFEGEVLDKARGHLPLAARHPQARRSARRRRPNPYPGMGSGTSGPGPSGDVRNA